MSKYIVVGIDYGTRFTKILYRDNSQVDAKAHVVTSPDFPDGLFPSLLYLREEILTPFHGNGGVIAYLKMIATYAVENYETAPNKALETAEIQIPEELEKLRGHYQDLDLAGLSLSYYFSCLLAETHRCVQERLEPQAGDKIMFQLGVPTALTEKNKDVMMLFRICLVNGHILYKKYHDKILQGLSFPEIYEVVENDVLLKYESIQKHYQHRCAIYPETAAAVAGFLFSKNSGEGIFITSDVGAGTVDLNIFRRNRPTDLNPDPELAYYSTQVSPLGAQRVADEFDYVSPMEPAVLQDELHNDIRDLFYRALQKQPNHGQNDGHRTYDSARIFLFGGGSALPIYKETIHQALDAGEEGNNAYGGVCNPMILDLPEYSEIEKPDRTVASGRYAVAYGLTTNPLNLAKITLPDEMRDIHRDAPPDGNPWNQPGYGFDWSDG